MEYANITLDIGAVVNAHKALWGGLDSFLISFQFS